MNLKHVPDEKLSQFDIDAQHPDEFIQFQKEEDHQKILQQWKACRLAKKKPPYSVEAFIDRFRYHHMPLSAAWLEENSSLI
jgi:hypothetical protein